MLPETSFPETTRPPLRLAGVERLRVVPDAGAYAALHRAGRSVPVWAEFDDPGWDAVDLVDALPPAAAVTLLETPGAPADLDRRSYLAWDPEYELLLRGRYLETWGRGSRRARRVDGDPCRALREFLAAEGAFRGHDASGFAGGLVGFVSYDFKNHLERLPDTVGDDLGTPDLRFRFVRRVVAWDHRRRRLRLCVAPRGASTRARTDYTTALRQLEQFYGEAVTLAAHATAADAPAAAGVAPPSAAPPSAAPLRSNLTRTEYDAMLARARQYILAGDIYQANLSHRFVAPFAGGGLPLYRHLRRINPSPFATYMRFPATGDLPHSEIVSCSPERLVRVEGRRVETRPIAGTRPRGIDVAADQVLEAELLANDKERAEHLMIVDMARNDIGRVCSLGSVVVERFMSVERYSHVRHLVSNVAGRLADGRDALDVLAATFPGASITGVPKVRCMQIIDELEKVRRGIYTGSAGYIGLDGSMDLNILIRTFLLQHERAWFHVGGGIVAASDPDREHHETLHKGRALQEALLACRSPQPGARLRAPAASKPAAEAACSPAPKSS